jgi:hypothetical protein
MLLREWTKWKGDGVAKERVRNNTTEPKTVSLRDSDTNSSSNDNDGEEKPQWGRRKW